VFLPINVTHTHWYLAVINADKHKVQVLDSLGDMFGRDDLNKVVRILEHSYLYIFLI